MDFDPIDTDEQFNADVRGLFYSGVVAGVCLSMFVVTVVALIVGYM